MFFFWRYIARLSSHRHLVCVLFFFFFTFSLLTSSLSVWKRRGEAQRKEEEEGEEGKEGGGGKGRRMPTTPFQVYMLTPKVPRQTVAPDTHPNADQGRMCRQGGAWGGASGRGNT